jgi:ribonuclease HI
MSLGSASKGAKQSQLFSDSQEQLTSISQTYKNILKYKKENVNGIKDDEQRIKENMKKLKEKLIQRRNQKIVEIVWHPLTPNPETWY